jgi:hypothetical protein
VGAATIFTLLGQTFAVMAPEPPPAYARDDAVTTGRRAAARLRLAIPARFVSIWETQECILIDVSRTGARVALARPLAVGQSGYLALARMQLFGTIVRRERGEDMAFNAMAFDEPICREEVLRIRSFAESFEQRRSQALREQVRRWVAGEI